MNLHSVGVRIVATVLIAATIGSASVAFAMGNRPLPPTSSGTPVPIPQTGRRQVEIGSAYRTGMAALNSRDYATAIAQFGTVVQATPRDPTANYFLGVSYVGAQDTRNARRSLERATREEGAPPDAWAQLGLVYLQLNERQKAQEQLDELASKLAACDAACGDTRRAQIQTAHDQLQQALAAGPAPAAPTTGWLPPGEGEGRAAFAAAVGLLNGERYEDALAQLSLARDALGPNADVYNYMGFANRKLHRYDTALGYYERALAINPEHTGATEYLGELYIEMGRMDDARRQLARLGRLCPYGCAEQEELSRWIVAANN